MKMARSIALSINDCIGPIFPDTLHYFSFCAEKLRLHTTTPTNRPIAEVQPLPKQERTHTLTPLTVDNEAAIQSMPRTDAAGMFVARFLSSCLCATVDD